METRANYVLIGLFALAVTVGAFVFVYWFSRAGEVGDRATYRIVFDGAVSGLRIGGAVFFNGIKVGEVSDLKLNSQNPRQVLAAITVDKSVPIRADAKVGQIGSFSRAIASHRQGPARRCCGLRDEGKDEGVAVLVVGIDKVNAEGPLWRVRLSVRFRSG
jgi:hypothetical protein